MYKQATLYLLTCEGSVRGPRGLVGGVQCCAVFLRPLPSSCFFQSFFPPVHFLLPSFPFILVFLAFHLFMSSCLTPASSSILLTFPFSIPFPPTSLCYSGLLPLIYFPFSPLSVSLSTPPFSCLIISSSLPLFPSFYLPYLPSISSSSYLYLLDPRVVKTLEKRM